MKKISILLLIILIVLSTTACEKNNKKAKKPKHDIELVDENKGYYTTFDYNKKNNNFTEAKYNYIDNNREVLFTNKKLNIEFEMRYSTYSTKVFETTKKARSKQKYFKEYKYGKYDAYTYGNLDDVIYLNINLGYKKKYGETLIITTIKRIDNDQSKTTKDRFDDKEVQKLFNTIKFKKEKVSKK